MDTKTKVMLYLGMVFALHAGITTSLVAVGRDWSATVGGITMFTYYAFAFFPARRAIWMAITFLVPMLGLSYFRFVRYDSMGVIVFLAAAGLAAGLVWMGKRKQRLSS